MAGLTPIVNCWKLKGLGVTRFTNKDLSPIENLAGLEEPLIR